MVNYLGIDFGTKIIGLSLFDCSLGFVIGLTQLKNDNNFIDELKEIIDQYKIKKIILGYPFLNNNLVSERHLIIQNFFNLLRNKFEDIEITLFDESYTTIQSISLLKKFNVKTSKLKNNKDLISSCIILENYLKSIHIL